MGTVRPLDGRGTSPLRCCRCAMTAAIDLETMERCVRWIADDRAEGARREFERGRGELLYPEERARCSSGSWRRSATGSGPGWDHQRVHRGACGGPGAGGESGRERRGCWCFHPGPRWRGLLAETVVEYHRAIIQASQLPVILFHRPAQFGGVVYLAETLAPARRARGRGWAEGGELRRHPLSSRSSGSTGRSPGRSRSSPATTPSSTSRISSGRTGPFLEWAPRRRRPQIAMLEAVAPGRPGGRRRSAGPARPALPGDLRRAPPGTTASDEGGPGVPGDPEERGRAGASSIRVGRGAGAHPASVEPRGAAVGAMMSDGSPKRTAGRASGRRDRRDLRAGPGDRARPCSRRARPWRSATSGSDRRMEALERRGDP